VELAGVINAEDIPLVSEPEAAALYALDATRPNSIGVGLSSLRGWVVDDVVIVGDLTRYFLSGDWRRSHGAYSTRWTHKVTIKQYYQFVCASVDGVDDSTLVHCFPGKQIPGRQRDEPTCTMSTMEAVTAAGAGGWFNDFVQRGDSAASWRRAFYDIRTSNSHTTQKDP
jgi:hypothetical protein